MVLSPPSDREMLDINEALMKSIKGSRAMKISALDIVADKTLSDRTKEAILTDNLKILCMQRDLLIGRIEQTHHELDAMHEKSLAILTETPK